MLKKALLLMDVFILVIIQTVLRNVTPTDKELGILGAEESFSSYKNWHICCMKRIHNLNSKV